MDICLYLSRKGMFKLGFVTILSFNCNFLELKELIIELNALVMQIVDNIILINEFEKNIRIDAIIDSIINILYSNLI
jgi:hypothetical protein